MDINKIKENPLIIFNIPENEYPQIITTIPSNNNNSNNNNNNNNNNNYHYNEEEEFIIDCNDNNIHNIHNCNENELNSTIPELLCNLKDIEVPIDNDIVFEVDENDSIKVSSPGTCSELRYGDILVSVNGRFIKSFTEGQTVLQEETADLHSKKSLFLRILVNKTQEEILIENTKQQEFIQLKNSLYYSTNFYSLSQQAYKKRHYQIALEYVQKAYNISKSICFNSISNNDCANNNNNNHNNNHNMLLTRLCKLLACCRELEGDCNLYLGNDLDSIKLYEEVITIRTLLYQNEYHISLYRPIDTLSRIYRHHSMFTQSLLYGEKLIELCQKNSLQHSSYKANSLTNLAKIKKKQLLLNESFLLEIESFQLRVLLYGYNHQSIGLSLLLIGEIKQDLGDIGSGTEEIYLKSLTIYQNLSKVSTELYSSELGDVYCSLASLYHQRNDHSKTIEYKLYEIKVRRLQGILTRKLLNSMWEMSLYLEEMDPIESSKYRQQTIDGMKRLYGESKIKKYKKYIKEHERKSKLINQQV